MRWFRGPEIAGRVGPAAMEPIAIGMLRRRNSDGGPEPMGRLSLSIWPTSAADRHTPERRRAEAHGAFGATVAGAGVVGAASAGLAPSMAVT